MKQYNEELRVPDQQFSWQWRFMLWTSGLWHRGVW